MLESQIIIGSINTKEEIDVMISVSHEGYRGIFPTYVSIGLHESVARDVLTRSIRRVPRELTVNLRRGESLGIKPFSISMRDAST